MTQILELAEKTIKSVIIIAFNFKKLSKNIENILKDPKQNFSK